MGMGASKAHPALRNPLCCPPRNAWHTYEGQEHGAGRKLGLSFLQIATQPLDHAQSATQSTTEMKDKSKVLVSELDILHNEVSVGGVGPAWHLLQ